MVPGSTVHVLFSKISFWWPFPFLPRAKVREKPWRALVASLRKGQWKRLRDGWILGPSLSSSTCARRKRRNWEPVTAPKKETVDDRLPVP